MKLTAVDWLGSKIQNMKIGNNQLLITDEDLNYLLNQAKEMDKQQKKDAYQHGRDDENCALSDGAMAPDYDNAEEWYKGEYGGEEWNYLQ